MTPQQIEKIKKALLQIQSSHYIFHRVLQRNMEAIDRIYPDKFMNKPLETLDAGKITPSRPPTSKS